MKSYLFAIIQKKQKNKKNNRGVGECNGFFWGRAEVEKLVP